MKVFIVLPDFREKEHLIISVRTNIKDALSDAKSYILENNKDFEFTEEYIALSPKDFYELFNNLWFTSPCIVEKEVT